MHTPISPDPLLYPFFLALCVLLPMVRRYGIYEPHGLKGAGQDKLRYQKREKILWDPQLSLAHSHVIWCGQLVTPKKETVNMEMHVLDVCLHCSGGGGKGLSSVIIKTRGEKWKLFSKEESLLRHADRMVELENHYHVTANRINELEKGHQ